MKQVAILFVLLLCFFSSHAQNFKGSIFFGGNFSHMVGDNMVGYNKPGFNLGFKVAYPIKKNLDISMAMSFSQKGSRRTYDQYGNQQGGANSWHLMRAGYVEIPVLAHLYLFDKLDLCAGLSASRLMGERLVRFQDGGPENEKILSNYELGLQLGAAFEYKENLYFFVRHSTSVFSVAKSDFGFFLAQRNVGLIHNVAMFGLEKKF